VPGSNYVDPKDINPKVQITGTYLDSGFVSHGFLRQADGTITTFDALPGPFEATDPSTINSARQIAGRYFDGAIPHDSLRQAGGTITECLVR
jgi:hypothetical protein